MQCPVCDTHSHVFLCAHCVNSSPDLLVSLKLDLIILNETNGQLREKIDDILKRRITDAPGLQRPAADKKDNIHNGSVNGVEVLDERLKRMEVLRATRRNSKIKFRLEQQNSRLDKKREQIEKLKLLLNASRTRRHEGLLEKRLNEQTEDLKNKLVVTHKLVEQAQTDKILSLNKWYMLRKRESFEIPYTLAYQPVLSLKNFNKFPLSLIEGSLIKMVQYINIFTKINFIQIPNFYIVNEVDFAANRDQVLKMKKKSPILVESLVKCVLQILLIMTRHLRLMNDDSQNIDFEWTLDQYDIDGLFYHMATVTSIDAKKTRKPTTWTVDRILEIICTALKVDKEDITLHNEEPVVNNLPANKTQRQLSHNQGLEKEQTDRWYIVG